MTQRHRGALTSLLMFAAAACGAPQGTSGPADASVADRGSDAPTVDVGAVDDGGLVVDAAPLGEDVATVDAPAPADVPMVRCAPGDCGPHGHSHGDHCDCDPGFVDRGSCCVPPPACAQPDDELEDNDTFGTATRVSDPAYTRGALRACPADLDVFRIALVVGQQVSVRVRFTHADGDIDAYLFNPNKTNFSHATPIARGDSTDDDEQLTFTATRRGEHVLVVSGYDGAENGYDLDVTITTP